MRKEAVDKIACIDKRFIFNIYDFVTDYDLLTDKQKSEKKYRAYAG